MVLTSKGLSIYLFHDIGSCLINDWDLKKLKVAQLTSYERGPW